MQGYRLGKRIRRARSVAVGAEQFGEVDEDPCMGRDVVAVGHGGERFPAEHDGFLRLAAARENAGAGCLPRGGVVRIRNLVQFSGCVFLASLRDEDVGEFVYVFEGSLHIGDHDLQASTGAVLTTEEPVEIVGGPYGAEALVLQARPIGEPVATYGPFVMNTQAEIEQAFADYRRTGFGGWPWPTDDPVHPREAGRFARHADGRVERAAGGPVEAERGG